MADLSDPRDMLAVIQLLAEQASTALADEHELGLQLAVLQLEQHAKALADLVRTW